MKSVKIFILNVFLSITRKSFKLMLSIANFHDSALDNEKSTPFILGLYDRFHLLVLNYVEKYDSWIAIKGTSKGETSRLTEYLNQFVTKLREWDAKVQVIFLEKTPDYKVVFPQGKKPFYHGTMEQRIGALSSMALVLEKYSSLSALKAEVAAFYALVYGEFKIHQVKQAAIKTASDELEAARVLLAEMLYGNLGLMMDHYKSEPERVSRFFPLELIRKKRKGDLDPLNNVYVLVLGANESKEAGISFDANTRFLLFNNGNAKVGIFTADAMDAEPITPTFILQPDEEKECTSADLGDTKNRYMFIVNMDETEESELEITVI